MDPVSLTYDYKRGSTLPRRTFLVNATVYPSGGRVVYESTAPDYVTGESLVRTRLTHQGGVSSFSLDMVREVVGAFDPDRPWATRPSVVVPREYEARAVVGNPYFGYGSGRR